MFYHVKHVTGYRYSEPVRESQMEVRMQPRTEGFQRCWSFRLNPSPRAEVSTYRDAMDNIVHYFDIPAPHSRLVIGTEAVIEVNEPPSLPDALDASAWTDLKSIIDEDDRAYEMLQTSRFAQPSDLLEQFMRENAIIRGTDPFTTLKDLNSLIARTFEYVPQSTRVDSPIDDALAAKRGVCQDFSHIFITIARQFGIPCRYVSGYLFHRTDAHDRSQVDATHAWVEALLPGLGWVGFDPTNDLIAQERHIRTAIGRDYADVPPTRGIFKGKAQTESELTVSVRVAPSNAPPQENSMSAAGWSSSSNDFASLQQMQQQQQ